VAANSGRPTVEHWLHHRLYLHYFDRELGTSVDFKPDEKLIREVTCCLLIASPVPLFCGLSPLYETTYKIGDIPRFVTQIENSGHLLALSSHTTNPEFLSARRDAYRHDRLRYPMYFEEQSSPLELIRPTPGMGGSTTHFLHEEFLKWVAVPPPDLKASVSDNSDHKKVLKAVEKALKRRGKEAITFALFRERLGNLGRHPRICGFIQREISTKYTQHYRLSQEGEIPTGIRGLEVYDPVAGMFPFYDVPLLTTIFRYLRAGEMVTPRRWDEFLARRGQIEHMLFADRLRVFIAGVCGAAGVNYPCPANAVTRERLRQSAIRFLRDEQEASWPEKTVADLLYAAAFRLGNIIKRGLDSTGFARGALPMEQEIKASSPTPILLAVAAEVEHATVLAAANAEGLPAPQRLFIGDHTYFALGVIGGCELFLVKCEAGAGGVGGSLATLNDAVRHIQPYSIIMPGIAFGLKPDNQQLCEVLLSKQIMAYDLKRVTEDKDGVVTITPRGDRPSASPRLHDRFWSGSRDWKVTKVHDGLIFSGDTLVDSPSFKKDLLKLEPEAIGGEMEAAGVCVAAVKGHIDWIIVKAICDWGENKDKKYQEPAANNAVCLVFHVIKQGGLKR
jgi:nucleoside phosphorylase